MSKTFAGVCCFAALISLVAPGCQHAPETPLEQAQRHLLRGRWQQAIDASNSLLAEDAENHEALLVRGHAYYATGHYDEAIEDLSRSIYLNDSDPVAYYVRANCLDRLGDVELARIDRLRGHRIDPEYLKAMGSAGMSALATPATKSSDAANGTRRRASAGDVVGAGFGAESETLEQDDPDGPRFDSERESADPAGAHLAEAGSGRVGPDADPFARAAAHRFSTSGSRLTESATDAGMQRRGMSSLRSTGSSLGSGELLTSTLVPLPVPETGENENPLYDSGRSLAGPGDRQSGHVLPDFPIDVHRRHAADMSPGGVGVARTRGATSRSSGEESAARATQPEIVDRKTRRRMHPFDVSQLGESGRTSPWSPQRFAPPASPWSAQSFAQRLPTSGAMPQGVSEEHSFAPPPAYAFPSQYAEPSPYTLPPAHSLPPAQGYAPEYALPPVAQRRPLPREIPPVGRRQVTDGSDILYPDRLTPRVSDRLR